MPQPTAEPEVAIQPLRLIFWGAIICLLDLSFSSTVNGKGWTFDLINDFVGTVMILIGVTKLGQIWLDDRYTAMMKFIIVVAVLSCINALHNHLIYDVATPVAFFFTIVGLAGMIATVLFCVAMRKLCLAWDLGRAADSWKMTCILFVAIYLLPLGLFYAAAAVALLTGSHFNVDLGPAGLLILPVFIVPLIHFFVSTSRMSREAGAVGSRAIG